MDAFDPDDIGPTQDFRASPAGEVGEDQARVIVIAGPMNGAVFGLGGTQMTLGRHPDTGIHLPLAGVSRLHCSFLMSADGEVAIQDEGAKNGTEVNGRRLQPDQPLLLRHGDTLRICESVLFFLNPHSTKLASASDPIDVDFGKAANEAGGVLGDTQALEALRALRKTRRRER